MPPKQKIHRFNSFIKIARMRGAPSFLMHGKAMPKLDLLHRLWPKTAVWSVGAKNMSSYRKDRKLAPLMQEVSGLRANLV